MSKYRWNHINLLKNMLFLSFSQRMLTMFSLFLLCMLFYVHRWFWKFERKISLSLSFYLNNKFTIMKCLCGAIYNKIYIDTMGNFLDFRISAQWHFLLFGMTISFHFDFNKTKTHKLHTHTQREEKLNI